MRRRLHEQYPSDVGVFCVYLLNSLVLEPGEALLGQELVRVQEQPVALVALLILASIIRAVGCVADITHARRVHDNRVTAARERIRAFPYGALRANSPCV